MYMKSKQIFLTPSAGKRLIAVALAQDASVLDAMKNHRIVIVAGTTNGYLAEELLKVLGVSDFRRETFFRGIIRRSATEKKQGEKVEDIVIDHGKVIKGKTIHDIADSLGSGDIIFKGANAVDISTGEAAVLAGNPTSGTMGPIYRAVAGRRVRLITPVGVEKRVTEPIHSLCLLCNDSSASGLRLVPSPGQAYTELDAIRALSQAEPHLIAGGGVYGCEGGAFFQCEGTAQQLSELMKFVTAANKTDLFPG